MNIPEIVAAFKATLDPFGVQVYDHVPDAPDLPCICVYPETIPYDRTQGGTYVILCLTGTVDMAGAQSTLWSWLGDDEDSLVALIDADNTLGGAVNSVCPIEVRDWGNKQSQDGRPRIIGGELICDVLAL